MAKAVMDKSMGMAKEAGLKAEVPLYHLLT